MKKVVKSILAVVLVCALTIWGVMPSDIKVSAAGKPTTGTSSFSLSCYQQSRSFSVYATGYWSVAATASFIRISGSSSGNGNATVKFDVCTNAAPTSRTGTIIVVNQYGKTEVTITQAAFAEDAALVLEKDPSGTYSNGETVLELVFNTPFSWYIENTNDFIKFNESSGSGSAGSKIVKVTLLENNTPYERTGSITLRVKDHSKSYKMTFTQKAGKSITNIAFAPCYYPAAGGVGTIVFDAAGPWQLAVPGGFAGASQYSGGAGRQMVSIGVSANPLPYIRNGVVAIVCCNQSYTVNYTQAPGAAIN